MGKKATKKRALMLSNIDEDTDPESLWDNIGNLGEGSFGMVQKVQHKKTGQLAAAKVIPVKYEEELEDFVVEVGTASVVGLTASPPGVTPLSAPAHQHTAPSPARCDCATRDCCGHCPPSQDGLVGRSDQHL